MKYRIEDRFDVGASRYWQVFYDEDFNRALWEALDIDCQVLAFERSGDGEDLVIRRTLRLTPRREIPRTMRRFVEGAVTYTEYDVFRARRNEMEVNTVPAFMTDRITSRGLYRLELLGPEQVSRIFDGECVCRIPVVGPAVAKAIVAEVEDSYRRATEFTRRFLRDHPA